MRGSTPGGLGCALTALSAAFGGGSSSAGAAATNFTVGAQPPNKCGKWDFIGRSGVPAMHAALLQNGNVVFLDKAEPWTHAVLPDGNYTFSTEFDPDTGTFFPLTVKTNTFCSAGGFLADGTLVNVGGAEAYRRTSEGYNVIRSLTPCKKEKRVPPVPAAGPPALPDEKCDWRMDGRVVLADHRWYPTVATLADGRLIVVGGSKQSTGINIDNLNVPTYEFYPREAGGSSIHMPFLVDTMPFNLYPGLHLLPNGRLFVWANNKAMEFDYMTNTVAKVHPDIPGPPRSYPLTGSSVLLPLDPRNNYKTEVIVFGGSEGMFPPAWNSSKGADSFARIDLSSEAPEWEIETMPLPRVMPDGVILADGTVFISNGAARGVAGYNVSVRVKASNPVMVPVIYSPLRPPGKRFRKMARARVPRMYHSVSLLLPNGQVLVAGSNPIDKPTEAPPSWLRWGTEFRVEAFSPPYLFSGRRRLEVVKAPARLAYGRRFWVTVRHVLRPRSGRRPPRLEAALVHTGFVTHSTHMSQRYVRLALVRRPPRREEPDRLYFVGPPGGAVAPPGPYMLFVLQNGVPCVRAPFVMVGP